MVIYITITHKIMHEEYENNPKNRADISPAHIGVPLPIANAYG
jgi:hypothetical protein